VRIDGKVCVPILNEVRARGLVAAGVGAGNDDRAALGVFVGGAIGLVLAAANASTVDVGLDELDVRSVASALAALWVTLATSTAVGVVLSSTVAGVQTVEGLGVDATGQLNVILSVLSLALLESDLLPEVGSKLALQAGRGLGAVSGHSARVLRVANVGFLVLGNDHAVVGGRGDLDHVVRCYASLEVTDVCLGDFDEGCSDGRANDGEESDEWGREQHDSERRGEERLGEEE
jgi:hypothetical protein